MARVLALLAAVLAVFLARAPAAEASFQPPRVGLENRIGGQKPYQPLASSQVALHVCECIEAFRVLRAGTASGSVVFLQRDPSGYVDSVNLYAGFALDPVNRRDPTGRCTDEDPDAGVQPSGGCPNEGRHEEEEDEADAGQGWREFFAAISIWAQEASCEDGEETRQCLKRRMSSFQKCLNGATTEERERWGLTEEEVEAACEAAGFEVAMTPIRGIARKIPRVGELASDREHCVSTYVLCKTRWETGQPCSDCLHYCITQGEWPFFRCAVKKKKKKSEKRKRRKPWPFPSRPPSWW